MNLFVVTEIFFIFTVIALIQLYTIAKTQTVYIKLYT